MTRLCRKCKIEKEDNKFSPTKRKANNGLSYYCKKCFREFFGKKDEEKKKALNTLLSNDEIRNATPNKKCSKCKEVKNSIEFGVDRNKKDGLKSSCKNCNNVRGILNRKNNPEKSKIYRAEYYLKNTERVRGYGKKYFQKNKSKEIRKRNKRRSERWYKEPKLRFRHLLSCSINSYLKNGGSKKSNKTETYLGCTIAYFRSYIESKFKEGMNWDNYGQRGWHLDHIRPCASFDFSKEEDKMSCFHYTNFQPLWWNENISKNSFYEGKKHCYADKKHKEGN